MCEPVALTRPRNRRNSLALVVTLPFRVNWLSKTVPIISIIEIVWDKLDISNLLRLNPISSAKDHDPAAPSELDPLPLTR